MPDKETIPEQVDRLYGRDGGWKKMKQIFGSQLPYETKLQTAKEQLYMSRTTAVRWYGKYRSYEGLK